MLPRAIISLRGLSTLLFDNADLQGWLQSMNCKHRSVNLNRNGNVLKSFKDSEVRGEEEKVITLSRSHQLLIIKEKSHSVAAPPLLYNV